MPMVQKGNPNLPAPPKATPIKTIKTLFENQSKDESFPKFEKLDNIFETFPAKSAELKKAETVTGPGVKESNDRYDAAENLVNEKIESIDVIENRLKLREKNSKRVEEQLSIILKAAGKAEDDKDRQMFLDGLKKKEDAINAKTKTTLKTENEKLVELKKKRDFAYEEFQKLLKDKDKAAIKRLKNEMNDLVKEWREIKDNINGDLTKDFRSKLSAIGEDTVSEYKRQINELLQKTRDERSKLANDAQRVYENSDIDFAEKTTWLITNGRNQTIWDTRIQTLKEISVLLNATDTALDDGEAEKLLIKLYASLVPEKIVSTLELYEKFKAKDARRRSIGGGSDDSDGSDSDTDAIANAFKLPSEIASVKSSVSAYYGLDAATHQYIRAAFLSSHNVDIGGY